MLGPLFQQGRTLCAKAIIALFLGLGMVCAIFAVCSCRWYMVDENYDVFHTHNNVDANLFLPEQQPSFDSSVVVGVGLFRYHQEIKGIAAAAATITEDDDDDYDHDYDLSHQCVPYPGRIWVGTHHPWKLTSQVCVVLGPIVAFVSLCLILVGNPTRFWGCTLVLLTTGLQMAGMVSSLSWCNHAHSYWHCPWLTGALVNLMACALFLVSWFLTLCGLTDDDNDNDSDNDTNDHKNDDAAAASVEKDGQNSVAVAVVTAAAAASHANNDETQPSNQSETITTSITTTGNNSNNNNGNANVNANGHDYPSSVCIARANSRDDSFAVSAVTDHRTQADIEHGVVALYRDDAIETTLAAPNFGIGGRKNATNGGNENGDGSSSQDSSLPTRDLYYDAGFSFDDTDDDSNGDSNDGTKKSAEARIANSNQIFLDLDIKMKELRDKRESKGNAHGRSTRTAKGR